jgi:hypothetical protein
MTDLSNKFKIFLLNRHFIGGIWIDARYAEDGVPFCEQKHVLDFPMLVQFQQPVEMEMEQGRDIVYRKETNVIAPSAKPEYWPLLFRIDSALQSDGAIITIMDGEL